MILILSKEYFFLNLHIMDLKKEFERFSHTFLGHPSILRRALSCGVDGPSNREDGEKE